MARGDDYGSILLGSAGETALRQRVRIQTLLTFCLIVANAIGVSIALALVLVGIPDPSVLVDKLWWVNFIALPIYVTAAFLIGIIGCTIIAVGRLQWTIHEKEPTRAEALRTQRLPWTLTMFQTLLWLIGLVMFTVMYGVLEPALIPKIIFVFGLAALVVVSIGYILIELALRPVAADLITYGYGRRKRSGLRARWVLAWITGSAIPLVGILLVGLFGVFRDETTKVELFVGVVVLALVGLATGPILTILGSMSIVGPIRTMQKAFNRVSKGSLDHADVVVYDGTEVGDLQAGFNNMVTGLRERERMRDLFGRHVGREVAEAALVGDPELGGSERTVAALFIDVIGSTTLASNRTPTEVVGLLNDFFAVIVDEIIEHDGLVNKFEGDAVLAIFGAPIALSDPAGSALAAARGIADRLPEAVPEISAGIGVGYGPVVAGNVGAIERFEYTVIGDPVNESARLSELAKRDPRRPLASQRAIDAALTTQSGAAEVREWEQLDAVTLRGRLEPTVVFGGIPGPAPRPAEDESTAAADPQTVR
ncbi:MAG: adenylate/guanylate cyclase domain-containing protein [Gordonia amarae]